VSYAFLDVHELNGGVRRIPPVTDSSKLIERL